VTTRVTLVTEHLRRPVPGGIGTYTRGLLGGLAANPRDGVDVRRWSSRLPGPLRTRLWDRGLGRLPGDVVHAPSLAFPNAGGALVVTVHDLAWRVVPDAFPDRGRAWHERALQRALRRADHFVVPSQATADALTAAGGRAERIAVIEEGCDHLPDPDEAAARTIVVGEFMLTVSTQEPRKNLNRLVAAYAKARPRLPEPWPLVVVGPAGWGTTRPPESDGVVLAGAVSEGALAGLYRRARAVAYVPLVEGFGLPAVEAMHAGAPVVASGAVPSVGDAALTVDPDDVDAIADALVAAATDDATRQDLIRRGRSRAAGLTWAAAASHHRDLGQALGR